MPADIKGFFMKNLTKEVEERLSEEGIVSLTKEYGSLDFVPSKLYSEEECISLIRSVSKILYGNDDRQSLYKVGKIIGKMHLKGQIAKGMDVKDVRAAWGTPDRESFSISEGENQQWNWSYYTPIGRFTEGTVILTFLNGKLINLVN